MWDYLRSFSTSVHKSAVMALILLMLMAFGREAETLLCYQCDAVDVANDSCSIEHNCTGKACIIYEQLDGGSTSTFCVYDLPESLKDGINNSRDCWLDPDNKGKHCICGTDMCNKPRDKLALINDPETLPISNATLIKKNPLIDYDDIWDDDDNDDNQMNAKPLPGNILFPNAAETDPRIAGDDSKDNEFADNDLVPIDHINYEYEEDRAAAKNHHNVGEKNKKLPDDQLSTDLPVNNSDNNGHRQHHRYHQPTVKHQPTTTENPNSGKCSIPPIFLLFFSSAAAVARLFS